MRAGAPGQQCQSTNAAIDHARRPAVCGNTSERRRDASRVERLDDGDLAAIGNDGGFPGFTHQQGFNRTSCRFDVRQVLAHILIHLDDEGDGYRRGTRVQAWGLQAAVVEDPKIGRLEAVDNPALPGKDHGGNRNQPDRDPNGGDLLRSNYGGETDGENGHYRSHGA